MKLRKIKMIKEQNTRLELEEGKTRATIFYHANKKFKAYFFRVENNGSWTFIFELESNRLKETIFRANRELNLNNW